MPVDKIHPFNSSQKIFTDIHSISLFLKLFNLSIQPTELAIVHLGDDIGPATAGVERPRDIQIPIVQMVVPADELNNMLLRLQNQDEVAAIFHHPDLVLNERTGSRIVFTIMTSRAAANRFVGMPT